MQTLPITKAPQIAEDEWMTFPGGELEGKRPKVLCRACRAKLPQAAIQASATNRANPENRANPPLCFQCYRAELDRERALKAAGEIDTASDARFQSSLPFEPVNRVRLDRLRAERVAERVTAQAGAGRYIDKRRHAQIAARHALQRIVVGVQAREAPRSEQERAIASVVHAAELQLPEAWLPFVVSR